MKSFYTFNFFIILVLAAKISLPQANDTTQVQTDENWSFIQNTGTGVGLWVGAASGAGFSLRIQGKPEQVGGQLTGYLIKSGDEIDGSIGMALYYPVLVLHSSRYMFYAGYGYFSDAKAESRAGIGFIGEWNYYRHLTVNIAIDALTYFSDNDFVIPLVSGGFFIYF